MRIVLVYTDAPGAIGTSPQVNNLDLTATVERHDLPRQRVHGPVQRHRAARADAANNYEAVFLPGGTSGALSFTVTGFNIAGDGVPNTGDATDQDFALVCYNCATCAGALSTDHPTYTCSSTIHITLGDSDLTGLGTHLVTIRSATEATPENVMLSESPANSGVFVGTFPTTGAAPAHGDGSISVSHGDTVTLGYLDASACGTPNITVELTAGIDCQPPVIANVHASNVTGNSASILWDTTEPASSGITYGAAPPPPGISPPPLPALTTSHAFPATGLAECTEYMYSVASSDAAGNTASDDNGGLYYTFATGVNAQPTYPYVGTPVDIPDANLTGAFASIDVADSKTIFDLNVTIGSLTHTYDGDITLYLIGPDNTVVMLSNKNGANGDNYTDTVFDDSASAPIAGGAAPFTGTFTPEAPLSAFTGKNSAGTWKLHVVDDTPADVGTIDDFSMTMTFSNQACNAPHAVYNSNTLVADGCAAGGGGATNGIWEAGERVQFKVNITADGTASLSGVSATIVSTTPGVTMVDDTATFPNLGVNGSADSNAPHFTVQLPAGLACGSSVNYQITIHSDQGSWVGNFNHGVGQIVPGNGTALNETFASGIPATWTVVDGGVGGSAGATTWTTANPGGRTIASPMSAPVAIVDSDNAGSITGVLQDEQLITPVMNLQTALTATLQFDQYFRWFNGNLSEIADVDVRSTLTGGAWLNVLRQQNASTANPDHKSIPITAQAAGAPDVQVRFRYYQAHFEWWWQLDNVKVDYTAPAGCNQNVCTAAPGIAKPVADGSYGTAMTGSRADALGSTIALTWDVSTCSSTDHHVLYGNLANVSSSAVSGASCHLGTSGAAAWTGVPAGNLWFVIVGDDDAAVEGSWGTMTGGERGGSAPSGQCGTTARDNSGTCP